MLQTQEQVSVTLLLGGGHSRTLALHRQDPLLGSLLSAIHAKARGQLGQVPPYHIRLDGGQQSLVFSASDLMGVITDPPLVIEAAPRPAPAAAVEASTPAVVKSRYVLLENFLAPAEHAELLRLLEAEEKRFVDSSVSTNDPDYRRSKILYDVPEVARLFRERIAAVAPSVMKELGIPAFQRGETEVQLTAHNDGNYFKLHNDSGSADTATRGLTYVYYFFNEPKAFAGGQFRLYDSVIAENQYRCGPHAVDIDPKNNSVLLFAPHCHHEVLPVRCPSKRFRDGRFTVNGWVRRAV
jgi:Rps23 Pro-64 3,4-dihydroxylase Tpa1-like proline 4-hydroxylase